MLPSPHAFALVAIPRLTTPTSSKSLVISGPPESPGHASMPMPPAASSPPTTLHPEVCSQVASVIVVAPTCCDAGSTVPLASVVPNPIT